LLHRSFGFAAIALGIAFELAGIIAVISSAGLILTIVLSAGQELWIVATAIAFWRPKYPQSIATSGPGVPEI
jgi:hypothetical protein